MLDACLTFGIDRACYGAQYALFLGIRRSPRKFDKKIEDVFAIAELVENVQVAFDMRSITYAEGALRTCRLRERSLYERRPYFKTADW